MILEVPQLQVIDRLRDYSSCASDAMGLRWSLRAPGARVSVCGYADTGKDCVLALLVQWWCSSPSSVTAMWARIALSLSFGLVLVFIAVFRLRRRGQGLRSRSPWFDARVHSCRGAETAPLVCLFS